jgi:hypothetical protein
MLLYLRSPNGALTVSPFAVGTLVWTGYLDFSMPNQHLLELLYLL